MIGSLVSAALLLQSDKKDVHIPAISLEKAIQQISASYHSPMSVTSTLRSEIIFIDATQVTESELRDQVAKSVGGSWERKEGEWHLRKDPVLGDLSRKRTALRLRLLQEMVDHRQKSESFKVELTNASASALYNRVKNEQPGFLMQGEAGFADPKERLMTRVLAKVDLQQIAAVDVGQRAVFALNPNAMQVQLKGSFDQEVEKFRKESQAWSAAAKLLDEDAAATEKAKKNPPTEMVDSNTVPEDIGNILMTVYSGDSCHDEMHLIFVPKNPNGDYFECQADSMESVLVALQGLGEEVLNGKTDEIKLSEESEDFQRFIQGNGSEIPAGRLKSRIAQFADPVSRDPLSYAFSEYGAAMAHKHHRNVIILPSESQLVSPKDLLDQVPVFDKIAETMKEVVSNEGSWMRIDFRVLEGSAFPRFDLKRIIGDVRTHRKFTIADQGEVVAAIPRWQSHTAIDQLIQHFEGSMPIQPPDDDILRILGLTTLAEQNQAMTPDGILVANLNPKLRQHLFECTYWNRQTRLTLGATFKFGSIYDMEPTLIAPDGISPDARLCIIRSTTPLICPVSADGTRGQTQSPDLIGQSQFWLEHPKDFPAVEKDSVPSGPFIRIARENVRFSVSVNRRCEWMSAFNQDSDGTEPPFTYATMPQDIRKLIQRGYQQAEQQWKQERANQKSSGGGGGGSTM